MLPALSPRRWARGKRDERDIEVAVAMFAAFTAQNTERMVALADPGVFVAGAPIAERTGRPDPYLRHEGLRELVRDLATTWTELRVTPREYRHLGGAVLVTATVTAHSQGAMLTGSVAWIYRMRRGKVASIEVFRSGTDALSAVSG
jgi:ketosteroid isomerase-like protein